MHENCLFFSATSITNLYVIKHYTNLDWNFLHPQLFLNCISAPPSLDLKIGIVSTIPNRLGGNRCKMQERSRKSKLASRHEDGKNMSPQKYYKLKPILMTLQATFWSIRQVLIEVWCNFENYYFFRCPKANFVLVFFHT